MKDNIKELMEKSKSIVKSHLLFDLEFKSNSDRERELETAITEFVDQYNWIASYLIIGRFSEVEKIFVMYPSFTDDYFVLLTKEESENEQLTSSITSEHERVHSLIKELAESKGLSF
jgi:hypothetical protein